MKLFRDFALRELTILRALSSTRERQIFRAALVRQHLVETQKKSGTLVGGGEELSAHSRCRLQPSRKQMLKELIDEIWAAEQSLPGIQPGSSIGTSHSNESETAATSTEPSQTGDDGKLAGAFAALSLESQRPPSTKKEVLWQSQHEEAASRTLLQPLDCSRILLIAADDGQQLDIQPKLESLVWEIRPPTTRASFSVRPSSPVSVHFRHAA